MFSALEHELHSCAEAVMITRPEGAIRAPVTPAMSLISSELARASSVFCACCVSKTSYRAYMIHGTRGRSINYYIGDQLN